MKEKIDWLVLKAKVIFYDWAIGWIYGKKSSNCPPFLTKWVEKDIVKIIENKNIHRDLNLLLDYFNIGICVKIQRNLLLKVNKIILKASKLYANKF